MPALSLGHGGRAVFVGLTSEPILDSVALPDIHDGIRRLEQREDDPDRIVVTPLPGQ
ncbi:hypothetical protein [Streptomyces sp. NPDC002088]|uniref:hypothetical protein n=1 Tax=Streptomyces sp. NPDC002088 TaxID=3154665 RepID=UPI00331B24DD